MKIGAKGYAQWNKDAKWWECECGAILPHGWGTESALVRCESCNKVWEYGRWELHRWAGDKVITGLQPRLLVPFNELRGGAE